MMQTTAQTTAPAGSAAMQGDLWSVRAIDYAEIQEPTFLPLYEESILARPEVASASALLDVGCSPGLGRANLGQKDRPRCRR